jgi:hypothetical protein
LLPYFDNYLTDEKEEQRIKAWLWKRLELGEFPQVFLPDLAA